MSYLAVVIRRRLSRRKEAEATHGGNGSPVADV